MTKTPTVQIVEQLEMQRLYVEYRLEQKLPSYRAEAIPVPDAGSMARLMHETFCCKKVVIRYIDPVSENEVALISHITPVQADRSQQIVISRLRIDDITYEANLFGLKV